MVGKKGAAVQETRVNEYGDGIAWFRGSMIGKGGFGCVYLATPKNPKYCYFPSVMAVKSAEVSVSGSIQKEREVLSNVQGCPNIIRCFGEETTISENGLMVYNLLLEYGSGGTLADRIKKSGGNGLPEIEVKVYTRSVLRGLNHIHGIGYVHCDIKPENILLVPNTRIGGISEFRSKIADFGLAKRDQQSKKRKWELYWRGTPMYLSPEAVVDSVQEFPSDVWAVGCIVLEMLTGKPPWDGKREMNADDILKKIGEGQELPKIPNGISKEARDFLKGCFVRKPVYRLTTEMLLNHPFLEGLTDDGDIEELEEVEDLNESEFTLLVSDSDDEFSHGLFPNECGFASEEDCFSYWSYEEEEDNVEVQSVCNLIEVGEFEVEELKGVVSSTIIGAESNQSIESSRQISSQVSATNRQKYPVSFTISAGI